ncbi:cell surface protein SprA [Flavobacterium sp.]|uniref:T9SS outer membrane translocon Sov/SprA n=1 Tax=Flavobacterium sp. TaxID=239 RepID=UPI003D2D2B58
MKNTVIKNTFYKFIQVIKVFVFIAPFLVFSQVNEEENDSIKTGVDIGKIEVPNPQSIVEAYTYDPGTDRYIYTNTFDGFNINYPLVLTPNQYQELVLREEMRKYYQEKSAAIDGKKAGSEEAKKDLLPRYYVNSRFFEAIFGSNTIDIKPTGSVELDLGVRFTKQDNPAFSPRNRKTTTFDFDQRISVGLQGKVGTRLNVNINYDTQSTFAFQNLIKLEYGSDEDDILQKLEVGNVSFPLSNSLIRGAQSLFGVKAQFQFGKTTVTGVFSEQKSQTRSVTSQGGGTLQDFEVFALDYDADRHYFLSQYFREQYDKALLNYPYINSRVQINRIEVWITNKQNRVNSTENNLRNIIALQDIGETQVSGVNPQELVAIDLALNPTFFNAPSDTPSDNANNKFNPNQIGSNFLNSNIREVATAGNGFNITGMNEGLDYAKLENARKLTASEFTFHPQLGYVSLNQKLANDEVLAVSYQYTIGDQVYQVGEFGTDGVDATQVSSTGVPTSQALLLKLLKSNLTAVKQKVPNDDLTMPTWNLMMKNIYQIPGAYQLQQEDFRLNILYTDPSPLNYITQSGVTPLPADVADTPLLKVFNVDKLNYTNDPQVGGDGFFDFVPGVTIDTQYGRIMFTTKEPFGEHIFEKLRSNVSEDYNNPTVIGSYNSNQSKYVFRNLYTSTQASALQDSDKNKFQIRGKFKSTGGDGISIGAFNVPQGSVVVTAGGRLLVEGVDYTVNYQLGRVQILDPSLQASNTPIEISVENNSVFGQQTRRFWGVNVEHQFNKNFLVGATLLNLSERPFTNKSNYGQESINNTIFGVNTNFSTEVPFLTRLVNKFPNIDTDVPSNLSFRGEIAYLKPGASKADQFNGEATTYVDDFEGSQSTIDLRSANTWSLASVPLEDNFDGDPSDNESTSDDLTIGYKRAKFSWYSIDPVFYTQTPSGINDNDLSLNSTRRIFINELYPVTNIAQGQSSVVNTLDLTYYPLERGAYNFNPALAATNQFPPIDAPNNWGGIMRSINTTNFEQSNVEYIQFWVMDPYYGNPSADITNTGKLVFNLGEIAEDVLKDGRKLYENGLPEVGSTQPIIATNWGEIPTSQSLIYAFDTNENNRTIQDVGFDGLSDAEEAIKFPAFASQPDPSNDNYQFYLNTTGGLVDRYRNYNGVEANSPVNVTDTNRGNTTLPDVEDINRDNTMNTINAYFKFEVPIDYYPEGSTVPTGQNYIADVREDNAVTLPNGTTGKVRWILYKIPIQEFTAANQVGSITDFRSIRFMRMYMTGFKDAVTLRFGALDLVRGEWRRYTSTLDALDADPDDDNTGFDVVAVNIQENGNRTPINYVTPPGVVREQLYNNNTVINQNEQSLSLRVYDKLGGNVNGLQLNDSRAVFKNVNVDMRQFKKLRMFLHAEALQDNTLADDELVAFLRFGNDFTENFYQIEIPLKVTPPGSTAPDIIWPLDNEIELPLDFLTKLKILNINNDPSIIVDPNGIGFIEEEDPVIGSSNNKLTLGIKGNPNFGLVRTIMVGVKNKNGGPTERGEVWFNELRLSDMDNKGGYAAVANLDTNLADFANVSATTRMSTIGFGGIEEGPNERSREEVFQYDIVTNINLGQLLPKKWGIKLPFNYAVGEETITPKFDPFYQDIQLNQLLDITSDPDERDNIENRAIDYTKRTSINFIGVRKDRAPEQKQHFYDVENLTLSYSFNETEHHDYEIESLVDQQNRSSVDYAYSFKPLEIEPFKKSEKLKKNGYYKMLTDFNFNFLPSNISFSSNIIRQFNRQQFRLVDVSGIGIDPLYRRNYFFNYQYGFNYNLTKSLKLNYTASSNNIVRNYLDENNVPIDGLGIWDDYWDIGESNQHNQQLVVNYDLPINKIPALAFVKSTYSYTGDYNWQRSSDAFSTIEAQDGTIYPLGNTIQNASSHKLNTTFNMDLFYRYIGLTGNKKSKNKKNTQGNKSAIPLPGQKLTAADKKSNSDGNVFIKGLKGILMSVKNIQANYTENNGTVLPGYLPGLGFFGSSKPSLGFVFGGQSDVRYLAAQNGWLTTFPEFNQNFTRVKTKQLDFTAQMELFPDLKIDLKADRSYTENYSEQYDVSSGQYNSRSPYEFGNYNISTILLSTSFSQSDENFSQAFQDFRENRLVVANRLATSYYGSSSFPTDTEGYPLGFGKNSQQVLLPSFIAAYSGKDAGSVSTGAFKDIPLPNWTIKYTGLMRYKFFKDKFKRFSLQHGYRASYNINAFTTNLNTSPVDVNGNFYSDKLISNVNLAEQFNPLMRIDFEMKNSIKILAEMKKDRTLNMSFDNNLLTEVSGNEYTLGIGYRIKDVTINSALADTKTGVIKSDINIKTDFTYRRNNTIVRYLDYDNNELAGGQNMWSIRLTADYSFSKNLTAIFFYDHQFSQAVISTSFPITNIRSGFTIRYNFGN